MITSSVNNGYYQFQNNTIQESEETINMRNEENNKKESYVDYNNLLNNMDESDREYANRLRRHLQFFFMDPMKKFQTRRQMPFKLALQVFKIVTVTIQLILFAELRVSHVDFIEDTSTFMRHKFLQNWNDERDVVSYPPSAGRYSVFDSSDILEHFAFATNAYYSIQNQTFASFSYDTSWKGVSFVNSTITFQTPIYDIPPMSLCIEKIANVKINKNNYEFDISSKKECKFLNYTSSEVIKLRNEPLYIKELLAKRNLTLTPEESLSISKIFLMFNLRTIHYSPANKDQTPECYLIKITISFDNSRHTGQVFIDLNSVISYEQICNGRILKAPIVSWDSIIVFVIDITVLVFCLFSFILCLRALIKAHLLKETTMSFFEKNIGKRMTITDQMDFINMWYLMIVVNDILIIFGTICKVTIEFRDFDNDLFTLTSIFLGSGALLVYVGLLRYLGFFNQYNVLVLTLKKSIPNILRFLVCAIILYGGFLIAGWVIIGPYSLKFRTLAKSSEALFSLLNGDDMFATFATINDSNGTIKAFGTIYIYVFVSLFIYVVLSLFIAIIMDAYEIIKERYKENEKKEASVLKEFVTSSETLDASDPANRHLFSPDALLKLGGPLFHERDIIYQIYERLYNFGRNIKQKILRN
ncbi:Polycystin cation channel, PKD1/PKD2 domain-containing protein [Strongyloides ratti]|uniref:Polycystin cation channel, PKD1/PKD2 domain-containing protein n=1 Tax=Strongyloides ratti TaxID=34506 RepID=A0A090KX69_STRRB|nr:Polycystin cation channel, PKD1/PKD2 domain-containing protein [Strongyloides ratti]CEF59832.1 Polycystin cation channel, PKD1/PKD2 domain-containing protein [Strongyloides ratti]